MGRLGPALTALAAIAALAIPATAEEPANYTFSPAPPGTVVQSQVVYLAGQAMHSQWRGVASKKLLGKANGEDAYQWYFSIYRIDGTVYHLKYQSPANGGPLETSTRTNGAPTWFPVQELKIVGAAQLQEPAVEQLVVQSHAMSADCGGGTVSVFTADAASGAVRPAVSVSNGCELTATIVHGTSGDTIALHGPYYGPNAAMCCPTKNNASATLAYRNGKWVETPNYYQLYVGKLPPQ